MVDTKTFKNFCDNGMFMPLSDELREVNTTFKQKNAMKNKHIQGGKIND